MCLPSKLWQRMESVCGPQFSLRHGRGMRATVPPTSDTGQGTLWEPHLVVREKRLFSSVLARSTMQVSALSASLSVCQRFTSKKREWPSPVVQAGSATHNSNQNTRSCCCHANRRSSQLPSIQALHQNAIASKWRSD